LEISGVTAWIDPAEQQEKRARVLAVPGKVDNRRVPRSNRRMQPWA
jgi:hypothetical protein